MVFFAIGSKMSLTFFEALELSRWFNHVFILIGFEMLGTILLPHCSHAAHAKLCQCSIFFLYLSSLSLIVVFSVNKGIILLTPNSTVF